MVWAAERLARRLEQRKMDAPVYQVFDTVMECIQANADAD